MAGGEGARARNCYAVTPAPHSFPGAPVPQNDCLQEPQEEGVDPTGREGHKLQQWWASLMS